MKAVNLEKTYRISLVGELIRKPRDQEITLALAVMRESSISIQWVSNLMPASCKLACSEAV